MSASTAESLGTFPEGGLLDPTTHPAAATIRIVDAADGRVVCEPRRAKVALVGFAQSTRMMAPFDDPEWEVWILNQLYRFTPRFDRHFEIHVREMFLADVVRDTNYLGWLRQCSRPIYMMDPGEDIPTAVRFPIERALQVTGRDYFQSSVDYMMALALMEGFEEIGIYGIDMVAGVEYEHQKPSASYWIGVAEARGVKVTIPSQSALCKQFYRYGQLPPGEGWIKEAELRARIATLQEKHDEAVSQAQAFAGAIQEAQYWHKVQDLRSKGAEVNLKG